MRSLRLLHLEDDLLDADLVQRELSKLTVAPTWVTVGSAEAFHSALESTRFDAVLSDQGVPGMDGLEALSMVRQRRPAAPFIFVSGNDDPRWAEHCLEAGATDYVPKNQLWRLPSALQRLHMACDHERVDRLMHGRGHLIDLVRQLSLARSKQAIVDIVRQGARRLSQADGATVVLRDGDQCHYVDEAAVTPLWRGQRFDMNTCISGLAMQLGQPIVVPDIYQDERMPHALYRTTFVKSLVMVPIRAEAPIGAIGTYWASEYEPSPEEVELIQALADSTALAFENVDLLEGLEQRVQQRTAELEHANKELEAFTYSVSHDLRAPVRAVRGYSELLATELHGLSHSTSQRFLGHIQQSALRMDHLIDDMLSLSKVSQTALRPREVPLGQMVREILNGLQAHDPHRDVTLNVDESLQAIGDAGLLMLALDNLLSNAWKFTSKRAKAVIEFDAALNDSGHRVYRVSDNGAGFDMRYVHQLFNPFRRLHTESDFPGTGVGLSITRRVILKHGGDIWAQSTPDQGACFYFTLPMGTVGHTPE